MRSVERIRTEDGGADGGNVDVMDLGRDLLAALDDLSEPVVFEDPAPREAAAHPIPPARRRTNMNSWTMRVFTNVNHPAKATVRARP
jgi:hypothetical protein